MKVGIVGLQQAGKTTLFRAITQGKAPIDEYGGKPNVGVVAVPDARFDWQVENISPKKATPATIEFIEGAAKIGEDQRGRFGSDFFQDVRAVDALLHVVRAFPGPLGEPPTPDKDARALAEELILADLQSVETRLARVEKSLHGTKKDATTPLTMERDLLLEIKDALESGRLLKALSLTPDQEKLIRGYDFMSQKPQIIVANIPEEEIGEPESASVKELRAYAQEAGILVTVLSAKVEAEVAELPQDEQKEYLEAMGLSEPARDRLIHETYGALGLIVFYTAGEPEVRSHSIPEGTQVIDAAAKIHTDLARGFIRAEVGHFEDVRAAGGWEEAKRAGKVELHTREYVVQDGDIIYIRFKV
ncbi:MAG: redox-regulated ATPase YchF [Armatimonadetes bacterium]|nr:redox-regulated ATPase YchF [Armatimonadota bacterium]